MHRLNYKQIQSHLHIMHTVRSICPHSNRRILVAAKGIVARDVQNKDMSNSSSNNLPQKSKVVICGGGLTAAAVAYHLSLRGWADRVVVVEKNRYIFTEPLVFINKLHISFAFISTG